MKYVLTFLTIFILTGCGSNQARPTQVIEKNTLRMVTVDRSFLQSCPIDPPPDPVIYQQVNRDHKEDLLMKYTMSLIVSIKKCNNDKAAVLQALEEQSKLVDKHNQDEEARVQALLQEKQGAKK